MKLDSRQVAAGKSREAVVLFSGGIDSMACVQLLRTQGLVVTGLFVDYAQAAFNCEEKAVASLSALLALKVHKICIEGFKRSESGEQAGRNALLLSTALFWAKEKSCVIATGIHSGSGYFDCSPQFLRTMSELFSAETDGRTGLASPFQDWSKQEIFQYAIREKLPLAATYSCESGTVPTCGHCASCRDRKALGC